MRSGDCKNFNGLLNDICKAGVSYESLAPKFCDRPCLPGSKFVSPTVQCLKFEAFTKEEEEANKDNLQELYRKTITARKAITDIYGSKKPVKNISENIKCPCCEIGTLYFSISSYNGHIHAKCNTDKCVQWME